MDNSKYRKTFIAFSVLIQQLYGQNDYSKVKHSLTVSKAKKYYIKILDSCLLAINETIVVVDKVQVNKLSSIITEGKSRIKQLKDFDTLDQTFISLQTEIIFQLIGNMPSRWQQKNVPNRGVYWKLNGHRQIQYVQDNKQKEYLIYNLLQTKYSSRFPDFFDFYNKIYMKECNNDLNKLMMWFKENHPDIYFELF